MSNLPYMAAFAAVVDKGSFTLAAEALNLSKSLISKQVSLLEDQLGVRLLNRTTRRLHLTEAGEIFYQYCYRIVKESEEAERAVAPLQTEACGSLRISAPQCLALTILNQLLPRFQEQYPKVDLNIEISGQFVDLVEAGFDVALRIGELEDSSLIARIVAPCPFYVCASADYWNRQGRPAHPRDLLTHNCLLYSQNQLGNHWKFTDKKGDMFKVTVSGNFTSDDAGLLLSAAKAGQGVVTGPSFMFKDAIRQGQLDTVLNDFYRTSDKLFVVYPYSKHVSSKVRVFVDFLIENANYFSH